MFYPREPMSLRAEVDTLLDLAQPRASATSCKAIVAPHAGYVYSGPVAASVFAGLADREEIKRVVLLGPAHRVAFQGISVPGVDAFATPLGVVKIDTVGAASLVAAGHAQELPAAHVGEHCLEVELPFLQRLFGEDVLVLPMLVGDAPPQSVANALASVWGGDETLVVVSSDMSHYHPYEEAVVIDRETCAQVLSGSASLSHEQACGATPWNALQIVASQKGLKPTLVDMRNSGDTAGDKSRVVGYGSFAYVPA